MLSRRSFIRGIAGIIAAPAIVRVSSLMPVVPVETYEHMRYLPLPPLKMEGEALSYDSIPPLLLPGIRKLRADYATIPTQWGKIFRNGRVA